MKLGEVIVTLQNISDNILLERTESLVAQERQILSHVLEHLREIDRRRLFSKLGYQSLFQYAVQRLKYSEDQAGRRVAAMRLVRELPEISKKIEDGTLTLSNIGLACHLFRSEEKFQDIKINRADKLELLTVLSGKTYREAQKIVIEKSSEPETLRPDRVRVVSESKMEVRFVAEASLLEKLDRIKGLISHSKPNLSLAELIEFLSDFAIEKLDPAQKSTRPAKTATTSKSWKAPEPTPTISTTSATLIPSAIESAPMSAIAPSTAIAAIAAMIPPAVSMPLATSATTLVLPSSVKTLCGSHNF
jgi:hypothetical protein